MDQTTRVRILHVTASPTDIPFDRSWHEARRDAPWLDDAHLRTLIGLDASVALPLVTRISPNHEAWPSLSDYMVALDDDAAARMLLDLIHRRGERFDASRDYAQAETRDVAREVGLFSWARPLVRIASHLVVETDAIDDGARDRIVEALGPCVTTGGGEAGVGFLVPGACTGAVLRLRRAMCPAEPWTPWR
jgi:hypothetical protein